MTGKLLTSKTRIVRMLEDAGIDMVFSIAGRNMGRLYTLSTTADGYRS